MKEYDANFSFYSEQNGDFEEITVKVEAENQFEARSMAWEKIESNEDLKFMSNIQLCGIVWKGSPLDMQDYFNAEAAYEKYKLTYIENIDKPNAEIQKNAGALERCEREKDGHNGSLLAIYNIAFDFGKPHGILPPTVFEELHYAREFLNLIDNYDFEKYSALLKKIQRAEKWDSASLYDIRDSFRHGYFSAGEYGYDFSSQLVKGGLCPNRIEKSNSNTKYISRWTYARECKSLRSLPLFDEKDIIPNSQTMQYAWQTLVLRKEALQTEKQTPVNSLWIANQESEADYDKDGDRPIIAENPLTGEIAEWKRTDFHGVLRPEKYANIDFEAIKSEYQSLSVEKRRETEVEKPSILAQIQDKSNEVRERAAPNGEEKKHSSNKEL